MCDFPRPLIPATPTRSVSLAPSTLPDALVPEMVNSEKAALVAAVVFKNSRRVNLDMFFSLVGRRVGWSVKPPVGQLAAGGDQHHSSPR